MSSQRSEEPDGIEGVFGRRLRLCSRVQLFETKDLILSCPDCHQFLLYCCPCSKRQIKPVPCHHFHLVFTDGACRNTGQVGATAGIGIAYGTDEESQYILPITNEIDLFSRRTSQRAELLAALEGINLFGWDDHPPPKQDHNSGANRTLIIATDSEYVVKGMTDWLPRWKANNWRNARNSTPANLDLFQKLDAIITAQEARLSIEIGFWHIYREFNGLADELAKAAALHGDPA